MHYLTKLKSQMMFFLSDYQATETGHQPSYYKDYGKVNSIKNVEDVNEDLHTVCKQETRKAIEKLPKYKVIKDLLDQNTVLAKCILTEKTFYIHKDYIVKNKNNRDIELMICNNWDQDISAMDQTKFPKQPDSTR